MDDSEAAKNRRISILEGLLKAGRRKMEQDSGMNIVDFPTAALAARLDDRAKRLAPTAEVIAAEHERLMPIKEAAEELAERLRAGELSPTLLMEIADLIGTPADKLDELYLFLSAVDEKIK